MELVGVVAQTLALIAGWRQLAAVKGEGVKKGAEWKSVLRAAP